MYFIEHWFTIWTGIVTAECSIKAGFINNGIETSIFILKLPSVHLFELQVWYFLFVVFTHLFYYCERNVNICDVLESVLEHFFTHFRVPASEIKDLERRLDILSNYIFDSAVSLVPIEWLLVFLISVFPVFLFTVLCHFQNWNVI